MPDTAYKTWIEISKSALRSNIKAFRSVLRKKTKLFAVVKSNAYGHGLELFSGLANQFGVDGFCVDSAIEGHKLRGLGIRRPILVLGPTLPNFFKEAAADELTLTISSAEALTALIKSRTPAAFHFKIDTGMHRQGFYPKDLPKVIKLIKNSKLEIGNCLKGAYTHFAAAKDATYPDYTFRQLSSFRRAQRLLGKAGFRDLTFHAAATGGVLLYPRAHMDLVRVGIGLYGYFPSKEARLQHVLILRKNIRLRPVLSWRARVSETKTLEPGDFVGYDLTEKIRAKMEAAVIPIGYWHGFPRALSSSGEVLIRGGRARVLGRVCMDLIAVAPPPGRRARWGKTATLIGEDGGDAIYADEFAARASTVSYEALTRLNPLIQRIAV